MAAELGQHCSLPSLRRQIFSKYQKHRRLLLDDILASIARLPSSKRGLRTYKLTSAGAGEADVHIQMLTALVLQLIQCVVVLPNYLSKAADHDRGDEEDREVEVRGRGSGVGRRLTGVKRPLQAGGCWGRDGFGERHG